MEPQYDSPDYQNAAIDCLSRLHAIRGTFRTDLELANACPHSVPTPESSGVTEVEYRNLVLRELKANALRDVEGLGLAAPMLPGALKTRELARRRVVYLLILIARDHQEDVEVCELLWELKIDSPRHFPDFSPILECLPTDRQIAIENVWCSLKRRRCQKLAEELRSIDVGPEHASVFHSHISDALETIFHPALRDPKKEEKINDGRKRVDITFYNGDGTDIRFFQELRVKFKVFCPFIFVECKNYKSEVSNPEMDQLLGRFSDRRGKFGIIVCRKVDDKVTMRRRCQDAFKDGRGTVFVFEDEDIRSLLLLRAEDKVSNIDAFMLERMRNLVM